VNQNNENNENDPSHDKPEPKYQVGEIVVVGRVYRYIYSSPIWMEPSDINSNGKWLYPVDYGLGLTNEGYHLDPEMRHCLEDDKLNLSSLLLNRKLQTVTK